MRKFKVLGYEVLEGRILKHGDPLHNAALTPDVDGDGQVNIFDLNLVSSSWGADNPIADANHDGTVDFFDINVISEAWGKMPHGDSATKQNEHLALLKLLPRTDATDIAIHDGDWNDPAVWYDGTVPTDGEKVLIVSHVEISGNAGKMAWLRVEGDLSLVGGTLQVGTLVGTSTAHLEATEGTIEFYGQVDTVADPFAFGVGMIWHGSAAIHGAEKSPYSFATGALAAGQQSIQVADTTGWQVGDKLVIAGTGLDADVEDDDVRYVTAIDGDSVSGRTVTLDSPLTFDHVLVDGHLPVIENLTRGVTFKTAAGSPDRGHVMFMHNPDVEVAYAAFSGLGRTDKTRAVSSPDGLGAGLDNPIGRYSLHFHRTGFQTAVAVVGNAIDGSPGWGFVNHESYVNADNNVSYNVVGAHYITETGNELGRFDGNVAVRSNGDLVRDPKLKFRNGEFRFADFGTGGDGYWMESALVPITNSINIGLSHVGILTSPGLGGHFDMRLADDVYFQTGPEGTQVNLAEWFNSENVGERFYPNSIRQFDESGALYHVFNTGFLPYRIADNFVSGSGVGILSLGYRSDAEHDGQIVNNTVVGPVGLVFDYSNRINIENNRVLSGTEAGEFHGRGIVHNFGSTALHFTDNTVVGFDVGVLLPVLNDVGTGEINTLDGGYYDNGYTNVLIQNTYTYGVSGGARTIEINDPVFGDSAVYNIEMNIGSFLFNINALYDDSGPFYQDRLGSIDPLFTEVATGRYTNVTRYNGQRLYFAEQATDFAFGQLLDNEPYDWTQEQRDYMLDLRHNDDGSFTSTGDLAAEGLIVGGVALPEGEQYYEPKVKGVFVRD